MYIFFNIMLMNKHHHHRFGDFGSWTPHEQHHELQRPTETPFLAIFASRSSWILRVVLNLWFRKVKVKRRLTLQVTRNWPKMRLDREIKVSRWPEHVDQLSPEFRDTVQTTDISTSLLMERQFVMQETSYLSVSWAGTSYLSVTQVTIVHEHSWYLLMIHLVITAPWFQIRFIGSMSQNILICRTETKIFP